MHPASKSVESEPGEPSDQGTHSHSELPAATSDLSNPSILAVNRASPVPPTFPGSYRGGGVILEGMDDAVEAPDFGTDPVNSRLVVENYPSPVSTTPSRLDRSVNITLEGMDNIMGLSDIGFGSSSTWPRQTPESAFSNWLPTLREIKQRMERFTEGRFGETPLLDQVRVPRCSPEKSSNTLHLIFSRANHQIVSSFAAMPCASS
jgi:hypothetical protein